MEFLKGESLSTRLARSGGRLSPEDTLRLGKQVASALAAAHGKAIVHRDLKPDNVMIVHDPEAPQGERAKVLDFGIAKLSDGGQGTGMEVKTRTGAMMGTPLYMSPEQCRGTGTVDDRSDVYSLGIRSSGRIEQILPPRARQLASRSPCFPPSSPPPRPV